MIKGKPDQKYESTAAYPTYSIFPLPAGPEARMRVASMPAFQWDNPGQPPNSPSRFFEGLLYLFPLCVIFWGVTIWGFCKLLD